MLGLATRITFVRYFTVAEIGQFVLDNLLLMLSMTTKDRGVDRYIIGNKK